jgi:hypothetical protein
MHICQQITERAWYSGSPHQTRFDELPGKGVLIVDTDGRGDPEFVPVPSIPLVILDKEPDKWPQPDEALVQFRPESAYYASGALPANVEYHPSVIVPALDSDSPASAQVVGIFDGLESALLGVGLRSELMPLAWRLAVKLAKAEGIEVALPPEYASAQDEPT